MRWCKFVRFVNMRTCTLRSIPSRCLHRLSVPSYNQSLHLEEGEKGIYRNMRRVFLIQFLQSFTFESPCYTIQNGMNGIHKFCNKSATILVVYIISHSIATCIPMYYVAPLYERHITLIQYAYPCSMLTS